MDTYGHEDVRWLEIGEFAWSLLRGEGKLSSVLNKADGKVWGLGENLIFQVSFCAISKYFSGIFLPS